MTRETVYEFWCPACCKGGSTPFIAGRTREGCPGCGGTLEWGNGLRLPLRPAPGPELFGVGPDEALYCPACNRGGPARLAARRPDGVLQCPVCTGLLERVTLPARPPQPPGPFVVIETEPPATSDAGRAGTRIRAYPCPACGGAALLPDPTSPVGVRRADTAGSVRVRDGVVLATCCYCGHEWAWALARAGLEELAP